MQLLNRLEKILGLGNCESKEFLDYIEEREKELLEVGRKIDDLRQTQTGNISDLRTEIVDLKKQLRELNNQIQLKEQTVAEIESREIPEIDYLVSEFFVPKNTTTPAIQITRTMGSPSIKGGKKRTFPRGCTVDGFHYENGNDAIRDLLSAGKIEKSDLPTSSYNAHLWLREKHSKFGFKYERDEN